MKLKNVLIVAKDTERSQRFYQDLFDPELVLDHDGNMVLTEGLVLWLFTEQRETQEGKSTF